MANIGTATIKITPEFDTESLGALDATLREAVAASLRRLADELTAKPTSGPVGAVRYSTVHIDNVGWGVTDQRMPGEWAWFDDDDDSPRAANDTADALNNGSKRDDWVWTPYGTTGEDTPASPEPALWGYNIGDRVHYTDGYISEVRIIKSVEAGTLALADKEGYLMGYAYAPSDIRPE